MIELNGWQRLWVFLSGGYLLVVVVIAFSSLPTTGNASSTDIVRQLPSHSLQLMANAKGQWYTVIEDEISIPLPIGLDQAAINTFKADYKNAVRAASDKNRLGHLLQAFVWWVVPSLLLYKPAPLYVWRSRCLGSSRI